MTRDMLTEYLNRWGMFVVVMATLITILLFIGSLAFIYWADEYAVPAWNENSVPAPQLY